MREVVIGAGKSAVQHCSGISPQLQVGEPAQQLPSNDGMPERPSAGPEREICSSILSDEETIGTVQPVLLSRDDAAKPDSTARPAA